MLEQSVFGSQDRSHEGAGQDHGDGILDQVFRVGFAVALALVLFVAGITVAVLEVFPTTFVSDGVAAGKAYLDKMASRKSVYGSDLWFPQRTQKQGVTIHDTSRAFGGLTLYTSGHDPAAFLIDMDGTVLHSWRRPFSSVWQGKERDIAQPQPDSHVYMRQARVLDNGDLLALYEGVGDTPYGYGLVKLSADSELLWRYPGRAHHQFDVGPDGRIYLLTHEIVDDKLPFLEHLARQRLEDFLVVLSPEGEVLQKTRLLTALFESPFKHMIYTVSGFALADPLHANSIKYISGRDAANFAFGEEGQILLSFRETNSIAVLDPAEQRIVWGTRGPWIGQHDPDILPNGNILLFDNYGNYSGPEGISRIVEFDPRDLRIVWQYAGTAEHPFESRIRGDQQRLPNGNTLITESSGGRIAEVAADGTVVWEFVNPVRGGEDNTKLPIVAWAERLRPADLNPALLQPDSETDNQARR